MAAIRRLVIGLAGAALLLSIGLAGARIGPAQVLFSDAPPPPDCASWNPICRVEPVGPVGPAGAPAPGLGAAPAALPGAPPAVSGFPTDPLISGFLNTHPANAPGPSIVR